MILAAPMPYEEAIAASAAKQPVRTDLSHAALRGIAPEVRRRADIMARVSSAELLDKSREAINRIAAGTSDRATQRAELKQLVDRLGLGATSDDERGTLTDLGSSRRLNLRLDTEVRTMQGAGNYLQGQDPAIADQWPAQELVDLNPGSTAHRRNWAERWVRAGGSFRGSRMVARIDDPVWRNLGSPSLFKDGLGNAYPPFALGSYWDVAPIDRDEAIELGIIDRDTQIARDDLDLLSDLELEPEVRDSALRDELATSLGGLAEFVGGVLRGLSAT